MSDAMTTDTRPRAADAPLGGRIRNELSRYRSRGSGLLEQAQSAGMDQFARFEGTALALQTELREVILRNVDKLRELLNVPTRDDVLSLSSRLDALDAKLAAMEAARAAAAQAPQRAAAKKPRAKTAKTADGAKKRKAAVPKAKRAPKPKNTAQKPASAPTED